MLRFPLFRSDSRTDEALSAEVRVAGGQADGALNWPHDPFFRPLIGFYVAGRLRTLATTTRKFRNGRWRCVFSFKVPAHEAGVIACVETGDILWSLPKLGGAALTVEDIAAKGREASRSGALNGFPSFLLLPLTDQINIIYRDFLHREPADEEIRSWSRRLSDGALSILDLRDEIAASLDLLQSTITIDDSSGALCLWPGFKDTLPYLVAAGDGDLRLVVAQTGSDPAGLLALTAVGRGQSPGAYLEWLQAHQEEVGRIAGKLSPRPTARPGRRYRTGNLLPVMTPGPGAVRHDDGRVEANRTGVVVYGPYMRVEAGHHKLEVVAEARRLGGRLALEIVHGDVLLAQRDFRLESEGPRARSVDFTLPTNLTNVTEIPEIEFRLTSDAAVIIESVRLWVHGGAADTAILELGSLRPGDAGTRAVDDTIVAERDAGRVFYGPYCRLLPGAYQFALECRVEESGDIELEVVSANTEVLAQLQTTLMPGTNRIQLPFALPSVDDEAALAGPLEFRLGKGNGFTLTCLAARLHKEGDGGPGLLDSDRRR